MTVRDHREHLATSFRRRDSALGAFPASESARRQAGPAGEGASEAAAIGEAEALADRLDVLRRVLQPFRGEPEAGAVLQVGVALVLFQGLQTQKVQLIPGNSTDPGLEDL